MLDSHSYSHEFLIRVLFRLSVSKLRSFHKIREVFIFCLLIQQVYEYLLLALFTGNDWNYSNFRKNMLVKSSFLHV